MIFNYVRSSNNLFTKADFLVSKANRKSVHFPYDWILALPNTVY